jgi:hypothetical protein
MKRMEARTLELRLLNLYCRALGETPTLQMKEHCDADKIKNRKGILQILTKEGC